MRLFRRRRGRHALGAAVTAIPSAPLPVAPPPQAREAEASPPPSVVMTPVAPELASEIAALIASGEAWRPTTGAAAPAPRVHVGAAPPPRVQVDAPPSSPSVGTAPPATPCALVSVPVQSSATAREVLEAALSELSTASDDAAPGQAPAALRVQLGFRDGTSTVLDPSSTQAQALEQLAQSLTRKD